MTWNNKMLVKIARILLGAILFVFGLNGFLNFMSMGPMPDAAGAFIGAIAGSGLIMVVKVFEVVLGLMFLTNRYTPLATLMLVPLSINFVFFHAVFAPASGMVAYATALLNLYFVLLYKNKFKSLLKA